MKIDPVRLLTWLTIFVCLTLFWTCVAVWIF